MKNSHTPAPWFVRKVNSSLTIVNNGGGRIAQTTSGKGLPTKQHEADTTLIAAAPDLHEMVQTYQDEPMPALFQARAAIAKATGEAAVPSPAQPQSRCTITLTREELVERILKSWEMEKGKMSPLTKWLAEDAADTILTTEGVITCK